VRAILDHAGHRTRAITLSDPRRSTLSGHIAQVLEMLRAGGPEPVVLVGHSYASLVITGAAAANPKAVARLVYVDSSLPLSGQSLWDIFAEAGADPGKWGVPAWPPFTERLAYDAGAIAALAKDYVHCTKSQFNELTAPLARLVSAGELGPGWRLIELDADHYCMLNHPAELAEALSA